MAAFLLSRIKSKLHEAFPQIHRWRSQRTLKRVFVKPWLLRQDCLDATIDARQSRVLIVPANLDDVMVSKGDEAMMRALLAEVRQTIQNPEICVLANRNSAFADNESFAVSVVTLSEQGSFVDQVVQLMNENGFAHVFVLGADIMDGYYSPILSTQLLIIADVAVRLGARSTILGFSFNERPADELRPVFDAIDARVKLICRDPKSHARLEKFASVRAESSADVSFLFDPNQDNDRLKEIEKYLAWIEGQRIGGQVVLGINTHASLVSHAKLESLEVFLSSFSNALGGLMGQRKVSVLLMPHDYREKAAEFHCLRQIEQVLSSRGFDSVLRIDEKLNAVDLKMLAGAVDGVITGRMHLAIAALGMGRPVFGVSYQGKFEGQFSHFGLNSKVLCSPADVLDQQSFQLKLIWFFDALPDLTQQVRARLSGVKKLAEKNFVNFF